MATMGDRLRAAMQARSYTAPMLIRATKLSKGAIYFILDGTTTAAKVRADTVKRICSTLSISEQWLLHGKGEMGATGIMPHDESVETRLVSLRATLVSLISALVGNSPTQAAIFSALLSESARRAGLSKDEGVIADALEIAREARSGAGSANPRA